MESVITPLYYLPPISCYAAYIQSEHIFLEGEEHYQKGTWRNKCAIATAQGPLLLSVPLLRGKHQSLNIQEVGISNQEDWKAQHWRSICTAYNNAPFFEHYEYFFQDIYRKDWKSLWDLNFSLLKVVDQCIGRQNKFQITQEYQPQYDDSFYDLRKEKRVRKEIPAYPQVHEGVVAFQSDMCVLDLIFHLGPEALTYLKRLPLK